MPDSSHHAYLGLGSNIEPFRHLPSALSTLAACYGNLECSKTYEGPAFGFAGPAFHNLVVGIRTSETLAQLSTNLKKIELRHGRILPSPRFSSRTLDIDLLTFDDLCGVYHGITLPRPEIYTAAYVLRPFAELNPELQLPGSGRSLFEMWYAYPQIQPLIEVDLCWQPTLESF